MKPALTGLARRPWAGSERSFRDLIAYAATGVDLEKAADRRDDVPKSLASRAGDRLEGTRIEIRDGVATVPVIGPLSRRSDWFTWLFGGTSYSRLARDFTRAIEDDSIKAVILDVDSPGGDANGNHEVAEMIFVARGTKPIVAYVGGMAASAAYWIASAANENVVSSPWGLGCIGTVIAFLDDRKWLEKQGLEEIVFVSSQAPLKWADPKTAEGAREYQTIVDSIAGVFVSTVARNRDLSDEEVLAAKGGVLIGQAAIDAGLGDRLGSYEGVLAELRESTREEMFMPGANKQQGDASPLTRERIIAESPTLAEAFRDEGRNEIKAKLEEEHAGALVTAREEAGKAERDRIAAIDAVPGAKGHEELLATLKADGKSTDKDAALAILKAEQSQRDKAAEDTDKDASALDNVGSPPAPQAEGKKAEEEALIKTMSEYGKQIQGR